MNNFKETFKKIYFLGRYPEKDWHRLLVLFIIIGIAVAAWSIYGFISIKNQPLASTNGNVSGKTLAESKEKELRAVLERYEAKARRYQELQTGNVIVSTSTEN